MVPRRDREQSRFLHGAITVAGRVRIERELDLAPVCSRQGRRNNYRDAPPINQDAHLPFSLESQGLCILLFPPDSLSLSRASPPLRYMFLATQSVERE